MALFDKVQILQQDKIPVNKITAEKLKLKKLTGETGMQNFITNKSLHRPQLALAGYVGLFNYHSVQIFGNTEIFYLKSLTKRKRIEAFKNLTHFPIPCIILTNDHKLEPELLDLAQKANIAVFNTPYDTTKITVILSEFLDDQFSTQAVVHGSFVDVYGVGVLFMGKSGIGKSEIALDLVERGHRLVADDIVMLTKKKESVLMGTGTSLVQHYMEIRGLGMIDVRQMFGIRSIRFQKRLEIIVELEEFQHESEYTRTGLDEERAELMGVELSKIKLPIFPGKNITVIAEVIALNYLLRIYGYNPGKIFSERLTSEIQKRTQANSSFHDIRYITDFQSDIE